MCDMASSPRAGVVVMRHQSASLSGGSWLSPPTRGLREPFCGRDHDRWNDRRRPHNLDPPARGHAPPRHSGAAHDRRPRAKRNPAHEGAGGVGASVYGRAIRGHVRAGRGFRMRAVAVPDLDDSIAAAEAELAELAKRRTAVAGRLTVLRQQRGDDTQAAVVADAPPADWPAARKVELFRSLVLRAGRRVRGSLGERSQAPRRLRAAVRKRVEARHLREAACPLRCVPEPSLRNPGRGGAARASPGSARHGDLSAPR